MEQQIILPAAIDPDPSWRERANCRGVDTALFFAEAINGRSPVVQEIKAICAACEVSAQCLRFAIDNHERGWWAGTSQRGRERMRRDRDASARRLPPIKHGTPNGPRAHLRRGEDPCEECREARNAAHRAWRANQRQQGAA